jgi:hypothetical protein
MDLVGWLDLLLVGRFGNDFAAWLDGWMGAIHALCLEPNAIKLDPNTINVTYKCRNVQMFAPAAHYQKQAKVLYFDTNCGSKAFQP